MMPVTKSGEIKTGRRQGALDRLQGQLKSGQKTAKGGVTSVALTEADKARIGREVEILKSRV